MNMSEKNYLIILIILFSLVAFFLWFWVIPSGLMDKELALGLLTNDIFMVLSIIFLTLLFNIRENADWNLVKDTVMEQLCWETSRLADVILSTSKSYDQIELMAMIANDKQERDKLYTFQLKHFDAKRINFDCYIGKDSDVYIKEFEKAYNKINALEIKYERFMNNNYMYSLIKIVISLDKLIFVIKRFDTYKQNHPDKDVETLTKENISDWVSEIVKGIIVLNKKVQSPRYSYELPDKKQTN
jgi:hypothetical protein